LVKATTAEKQLASYCCPRVVAACVGKVSAYVALAVRLIGQHEFKHLHLPLANQTRPLCVAVGFDGSWLTHAAASPSFRKREIEKLRRLADNEQPMETAPTKRRSWLRPRFSLRAALLTFTAFAVGFPIWWRWPYEETEVYIEDAGSTPVTRITSWQRQWGGGRLKHGPEREIIPGYAVVTFTYKNGQWHGPHTWIPLPKDGASFVNSGEPVLSGQYFDGQRDGVWTEVIDDQKTVTTWHHGKQVSP
jgi:hypothetical protein